MSVSIPRRTPFVCRACRRNIKITTIIRTYASIAQRPSSLQDQLARGSNDKTNKKPKIARRILANTEHAAEDGESKPTMSILDAIRLSGKQSGESSPQPTPDMIANPRQVLRQIQEDALAILDSERIPEEPVLLELFTRAHQLATLFAHPERYAQPNTIEAISRDVTAPQIENPSSRTPTRTPRAKQRTSLLLDLDEPAVTTPIVSTTTSEIAIPTTTQASNKPQTEITTLLRTLYTLLEAPQIYMSESILSPYVHICTTLSSPTYLPKIFHLYATKPIPTGSSPNIIYTTPNSKLPKYAIPPSLVTLSLESAMQSKDLPLCISLINTTVSTSSYRTARFIRRAALPLLGTASILPLTHAAATYISTWQVSFDPSTFYYMTLSGATAYLGTMGTLLYITLTTWNDHHKRIRWVPGTPMSRRWLREDERYWFDRVAQTWGFEDENRHGEESSEEWEVLREECARRWMELDRSSTLPGML